MYFDGSLKLGGAGVGVLFISLDGKQLKYVLQILWQATNNEAEYEALIHGLRVAITLGIKRLLVYGDSVVVINQARMITRERLSKKRQRKTRHKDRRKTSIQRRSGSKTYLELFTKRSR